MSFIRTPLLVFIAALSISGLLPSSTAAQTFSDGSSLLPSSPISTFGASVVDLDGDGRTDLLSGALVYLQRDDGFVEIDTEIELVLGALVADMDTDGVRDVIFLQAYMPGIAKYLPARMAFRPLQPFPISTDNFPLVQGSILFDYNQDGHLDILLGNDGPPDVLLRGAGDGTYLDVSTSMLPTVNGGTYGMAAADYDRDGDLDVAIGLCYPLPAPNLFYLRDGDVYEEVATSVGAADPLASWGVAWLDYDGDGWLDLFTANMPRLENGVNYEGRNSLARNNGDGTFTNMATQAGVAGPADEQNWSTVAADFDNDGWTDLFVANRPPPSRLWRNRGDGTFEDVTTTTGLGAINTMALAAGDVDGDGWVDLFIPSPGHPTLFLNDGGTNSWLAIRLRGTTSNREGIGARVEVTAGARTQVREITGGDGMMSHNHALEAHFGLGTMTTAEVTVHWPSGETTTVTGVAANQRITIVEGEGRNNPPDTFALTTPPDGSDVQAGGFVTLGWEAAQDEDAVAYTVILSAPDSSETTYTTTETRLELPASVFAQIGSYGWTVAATDGRSTRFANAPWTLERMGVTAIEEEIPTHRPVLQLFPNPSANNIHLSGLPAGRTEVAIFNLLGQQLRTITLAADPKGMASLDLNGLSPGLYLIRTVDAVGTVHTAHFTRMR